jgi:hypothetical protein
MLHAKQALKRKRRSKAVPVLGAAGLLSLASGAVAQEAGPAANLPTRIIEPSHELTLSEEEVFDATAAATQWAAAEASTLAAVADAALEAAAVAAVADADVAVSGGGGGGCCLSWGACHFC